MCVLYMLTQTKNERPSSLNFTSMINYGSSSLFIIKVQFQAAVTQRLNAEDANARTYFSRINKLHSPPSPAATATARKDTSNPRQLWCHATMNNRAAALTQFNVMRRSFRIFTQKPTEKKKAGG